MRFIEWIEVLRALGVEKIILSVLSVHSNVMKVDLNDSIGAVTFYDLQGV